MKRLLFGGLAALGLVLTAAPVKADVYFESSCCRHTCFVRTARNRCWSFNSHVNPLPCMSHGGGGYSGPAPWNALAAYGYPPPVAPVAAARPAAAPAAAPTFKAPQPAPAANTTGVQQAGYFYYGQTNNAGYGYNAGYNYGAGYGYYGYGAGYSYAQAPNYWY